MLRGGLALAVDRTMPVKQIMMGVIMGMGMGMGMGVSVGVGVGVA